MRQIRWFLLFPLAIFLLSLGFCTSEPDDSTETEETATTSPFLNLHDSVGYVGMETCRSCHQNVFETFIHTGMGQSFGKATRERSDAEFGPHVVIYDSISNYYYKPFWENDSFKVMEYRLAQNGKDTIHKRIEDISYIIGSGHHTNSHMINHNGYVFQAPVTYYTQRERWDMAPGFEGGFNSRFSRIIGMECMSCHNALPDYNPASENSFEVVPQGIDCERCHGPGELHVKEKLAGNRIDTSKYADYTIVNPSRLSKELQMSVCQRCHLQGVAVLNEGKSFSDFKPGMDLKEVLQVFLPQYEHPGDDFIMASHAERLRMSPCYIKSELTCITCHNPHVSVQVDQTASFINTCQSCHSTKDTCDLSFVERVEINNNNCLTCHMPKSGAIDIPHVSVTDHYIHVPEEGKLAHQALPLNTRMQAPQHDPATFTGLASMTDRNPSPLLMSRGYLRFYEGFSQNPAYLDSAAFYLNRSSAPAGEKLSVAIQLFYLKGNYPAVIDQVESANSAAITDAFTLYRIGDSYFHQGQYDEALEFIEKAVQVKRLNFEFQNKLGTIYVYKGQLGKAQEVFEFLVNQNNRYVPALSNLGIVYINLGQGERGERLLQQAIQLDPDYELAYFNLADYYNKRYKKQEAVQVMRQLLQHQPENVRAQEALRNIR